MVFGRASYFSLFLEGVCWALGQVFVLFDADLLCGLLVFEDLGFVFSFFLDFYVGVVNGWTINLLAHLPLPFLKNLLF